MAKIFVLDTNVLLYDAQAFAAFHDNQVIIPFVVLGELDEKKNRQDEVGKNARSVIRGLDDLRQKGNLADGVTNEYGGLLRVLTSNDKLDFTTKSADEVDNAIIELTKDIQDKNQDVDVILVTKDINVRVKCDALKLRCEDYLKHRLVTDADAMYRGVQTIRIPTENINRFFKDGALDIPSDVLNEIDLYPNQFIVAKDITGTSQSAMARYVKKGQPARKMSAAPPAAFGLSPRNKEQGFALDLLFDEKIDLVTLVGAAGTGKTLLAVAAGIHQLLEDQKYSKLVIMRPLIPMGKDIGYLPGTIDEKMAPWIAPIMDNLKFLFSGGKKERDMSENDILQMYFEKDIIEVEALTFIRGRSISNAFIIIDEAQNLTAHELKTIVTRVGEHTKIVLTGDIEQIDNAYVDAVSNGLTYTVEKFKDYDLAGHITLIKGERSALASLAAKIL